MTDERRRSANRRSSKAWRDRKKAAGFRILHGYAVDTPHINRPADVEPPHGTVSRYYARRWRCRCAECRAAAAANNRRYPRTKGQP